MPGPLATQGDLEDSLGRALTSAEDGKADAALRYASNLVRAMAPWVDTLDPLPDAVLDVVVSLGERRFLARRDGLRSAGPFTYADSLATTFTPDERLLLASALGLSGNLTVSIAGPDPDPVV